MIRRTPALTEFVALDLAAEAREDRGPHGRACGGARRQLFAIGRQSRQL